MGRGGGDCIRPGDDVPDDGGEDSGRDECQRDALRLRLGIITLRNQLLDGVGHAGTNRKNRKWRNQLNNRGPNKSRIGPHRTAGNQRRNDIAAIVKAVYICKNESEKNQNPKREMHDTMTLQSRKRLRKELKENPIGRYKVEV